MRLSLQGASGDASVPERRGPVSAQGFVQEEPRQQAGLVSARERGFHKWQQIRFILLTVDVFLFGFFAGSGADGAEEIKRHGFFSTIDWNVGDSQGLF